MKIHGMWYSNATGRVLATLCEKEIDFELIPVDIMKGDQKKPEFLAIQVHFSLNVTSQDQFKLIF